MIALTLSEVATAVGGALNSSADAASVVSGDSHTDSRLVTPGAIFFAMRGETTDGHLFVDAAVAAGAALVIVDHELDVPVPQIVVADTLIALADLARDVVARVRAGGELKVVGITGSNGKTTTKNMLRAILSPEGETIAPEGSFNNEVGAPISMLGVTASSRFLIVEMGASGIGEIANLVSIATPDVAIALKVGLAHVGEFGGPDAIARAKSEIVTALPPTAVAILNADDGRVADMAALTVAGVVWFGQSPRADVRAENIEAGASGTSFDLIVDGVTLPVTLRILGEHHVMNALAAIAAARALGVAPEKAVPVIESLVRAERWRMEVLERPDGVTIINDAYNASPDSMAAALKTLAQIARTGRRSFAILGEMAELGEYADDEHDRIGRLAVRLNVAQLIVVGHRARHIHNAAGLEGSWDGESVLVADVDEAYDVVRDQLREGDVVLVKSSKSAGLRFLGDRLAGVTS